ncbi:MAG: zinc-binding alcohol dehydrogenase [Pseudomonadota bacterium]
MRDTPLTVMDAASVEITAEASLISRGTERLVFSGRVPQGEIDRMRCPMQEGAFPFPVKYGYALAGHVSDGPQDLVGKKVFSLAPHQARIRVPIAMARPLPEGLTPARAVLAANMETALNASWDAPLAPGMKVAVVGLGLVGLLIVSVLSRRGDLTLRACDILSDRATLVSSFGATFAAPADLPDDHDVVFHASASAAGLATALDALAFEGTCIEASWFGDAPVAVPLGGAFHSRRLRLVSTQVGHVAPSRRAALTHADRLDRALALCADPRLDALVTEEVAFADLPARLPALLAPGAPGIATRVVYR